MALFHVIEQIDISHEGPVAFGQKIHLAQGDMDGACGPYSIMMSLITCGLINRDELVGLESVDGRTNPWKLLKMIQKYQGLFRDGTDTDELKTMLINSYKTKLDVVVPEEEGLENDIRQFVKVHLDQNHPVILWLKPPQSGGHWVVAIGYEYNEVLKSKRKEKDTDELAHRAVRKPLRFLLLDPGNTAPIVSAWNGVVDAIGTKGSYPFIWWGNDNKVRFHSALALSPKG